MVRELNEQWVEEIDGKMHMLKAVEGGEHWCDGCCFNTGLGNCSWDSPKYCRNGSEYRIKDLGILNDDGLLPCPFCGEYPTLKEELDEQDERIYAVEHECNLDMTTGWDHDKQTVIEAWNRRI